MEIVSLVLVPFSAGVLLILTVLSGTAMIKGADKWPAFYQDLARLYDRHFSDAPFVSWWSKASVGASEKPLDPNRYRLTGAFIIFIGIATAALAGFWLYVTLSTAGYI